MKKALCAAVCAAMIMSGDSVIVGDGFVPSVAEIKAEAWQGHMTTNRELILGTLDRWAGDWYDEDGKHAFTIGDGKFIGCPVVALGIAGNRGTFTGSIRINKNGKLIDLDIRGEDIGGKDSVGKSRNRLIVGKRVFYRSPEGEPYTASVGGMHIGIRIGKVFKLYGQPDNGYTPGSKKGWLEWKKYKFSVSYDSEIVKSITLYDGCELTFDEIGLGFANSIEDFAEAFDAERICRPYDGAEYVRTGHFREYVWIKEDGKTGERTVSLNPYWN